MGHCCHKRLQELPALHAVQTSAPLTQDSGPGRTCILWGRGTKKPSRSRGARGLWRSQPHGTFRSDSQLSALWEGNAYC